MPNYNKVLLMGNITRDIELKHTPSNQAVATIGLAVNRRYKTKEGEDREDVTYVDCEAWGRTAEVIHQYFGKGKPIFVEGRLKLDQWEDKEGKKQSRLRVVIEGFEFVEGRSGGPSGGGASAGGGGESAPRSGSRGDYSPARSSGNRGGQSSHQPVQEDDIPF
jgi:single-strand DNA-binding protein